MKKITVTFDSKRPKINGRITNPYSGNQNNSGRHVYVNREFVLKVDDRGFSHDDLSVWEIIEPKDRKYFVPILAQGYTDDEDAWSIQPYIKLNWNQTQEAEEIVDELIQKYNLHDCHDENWAMHKGHPIIFDYGMV